MRKMMLLAATVAIATLMMAAAPAFAQDNGGPFRPIDGAEIKRGDCGGFEGVQLTRAEVIAEFGEEALEEAFPGVGGGVPFFCVDFDDDDGNGNGRDNDRDFRDLCRFFDCRDNDNNNVVPAFEITQDFEQEAESGDIDQSFDVSQTGDNSNQTVGIQGVANTGNAQNQIGVIDAGNGFGDFDANNDDERFFFVDDFCDFDSNGDGICDRLDRLEDRFEDLCEDGNNDGFCDRLENRIENLEDEIDDGFFFVVDDFDNDDDRFFGNNGSDFEFEDVGSTIEVSPTNTVTSDQQVNQAATAFGK
jgi:hypothetical protein